MKISNTIMFFIKSFFIFIIMAMVATVLSWVVLEPFGQNMMIKLSTQIGLNKDRQNGSSSIVIITVDDKSIAYHRWPWPRDYYAKIFRYLHDYSKPSVIGYDSLIQNLDKENPEADKVFFNSIKDIDNLVVGFAGLTENVYEQSRVDKYAADFYGKFKLKVNNPENIEFYGYSGISEYPKEYFNSVNHVGSVNVIPDAQGVLRHYPQLIAVQGKFYPSLGLRMYMKMFGADELTLTQDKLIVGKTGAIIPGYIGLNGEGFMSMLRYYKGLNNSGLYSHKTYSASDIIQSYDLIKSGKKPIVDPKEFAGKIVFVGSHTYATANGPIDSLRTPIQNGHPGVDIQATNLDNIINSNYMKDSGVLYEFVVFLFMTILTFGLILKFSFFVSLLSIIAVGIIYLAFVYFCYYNGFGVEVITPFVNISLTSIFAYSYRFILEGKNKEKIKQAMGKYLSQDIMKNVVQNIDDIKLGGKRTVVTVLFADIRGFTAISEKMSAEDVSKILNEYFTEIEPIISKYNGVINKFIGDAVMAIFGEPIQDIHHPENAVKCANEMLKKVSNLREKWMFEGKPKIEIGVGINTGECFVGNIGSEKRLEYTVIGDTVNLASRIESFNKVYHTNFLVSSSTYSYVNTIADVIKISEVTIRGKSKKMDIYEILRLNDK